MSLSSDDDILLFPITDVDSYDGGDECDNEPIKNTPVAKPAMTLRQRRLSKSLESGNSKQPLNINLNKLKWLRAIRRARSLDDPWGSFKIEKLTSEKCIRHRYNALKKTWVKDEVQIKMENEAFNRGAMRMCYRLKKLSNFTHNSDWSHAQNYVAKHYIEVVSRDVYFEDVKLQMDAKLWGEEYNRHNPPKKIDIFQMYALEFVERPDSPLYHLEHFMDGDYIKYNSNSGFVDEHSRLTPQAFSHFTFERSGHQLIVVDVQGVGDLYTDPQIHTIEGNEYGDGNLGAKGMALFFHSHTCNKICVALGLSHFDQSPKESQNLDGAAKAQMIPSATRVRGVEEMCISASPREAIDLTNFLARQRSSSSMSSIGSPPVEFTLRVDEPMSPDVDSPPARPRGRVRFVSESESSSFTEDEERELFMKMAQQRARPSCVSSEIDLRKLNQLRIGDSILGKIHHEMAKYYELGRFCVGESEDIDWESALYHEEHAAQLGVMEAILTMAKLYLGIPRDVLVNCVVEKSEENINEGVEYMIQAAEAGDRSAIIYIAKAYQTGDGLGTDRTLSWDEAAYWYEKSISVDEHDDSGEYDSTMHDPMYELKAQLAQLYHQGGNGLKKDPQKAGDLYNDAAEEAMGAMKGRLANKYFALAEDVWAECEEE